MRIIALILIIGCSIISCDNTSIPLPKPRVYPKIEYPVRDYIQFESNTCPFTMTIPSYFQFKQDNSKIKSEEQYTCWFDLVCTELNANLHLSYVPIKSPAKLDEMVQDAFEMADRHNVKASYRDEIKINNNLKNIYGILFKIGGPVASPTQFYMTDGRDHFLRGSLYYNDIVNRDSIAPIHEFLEVDINNLLETFTWK